MQTSSYLDDFKKTGYKITTPRMEILSVLSPSLPVSAQEISGKLKQKGISVDLVTIYRTLELFENLRIITKIQFEDNTARFELTSTNEHHHHLICIKCAGVGEVEANENSFFNTVGDSTNFKILRHSLEFFGLCRGCQ